MITVAKRIWRDPMWSFVVWALIVASMVLWGVSDLFAQQPQPHTTQEQIEKTIGSLFIKNAQCNEINAQLAERNRQLTAQVAALSKQLQTSGKKP